MDTKFLLSLGQGIDLIHFSNARSTSPNLGINTVAAKFSVRYTLTKQSERLSTPRSGKG